MADYKFKSVGVKTQEINRSFASSPTLGFTSVGMIGETLKGPAFAPTLVTDKTEFRKIFGGTSTEKINSSVNGGRLKFLAPTYANSFLEEGNQLYFTKILGLSGYDAGKGWAIVAGTGVDFTTTAITNTSTGSSVSYSGTSFSGINFTGIGLYDNLPLTYTKTGSIFTAQTVYLDITTFSASSASTTGVLDFTTVTYTANTNPEYENMVLGILRSRGSGSVFNGTHSFNVTSVTGTFTNTSGAPLNTFTLTAVGTSVNEKLEFNLDFTSASFIDKAIGRTNSDNKSNLYIESIYSDTIRKLALESYIYEIKGLVELDSNVFNNFRNKFTNPETPWLVSELNGSNVNRLFKFISFSDGDSANKEVKISIESINPVTKEFDIVIRDFNDTDENQNILEQYPRCNMNPDDTNFVMRRVGGVFSNAENEFYEDPRSAFVYVSVNIDAPIYSFPCGFEGYMLRDYSDINTGTSSAKTPSMIYKKSYTSTDKVYKTYLGITEKAFNTTNTKGVSINPDLFKYNGASSSEETFYKTKGFHLDSGATGTYTSFDSSGSIITIGEFEVGAGELRNQASVSSGSYSDIGKRKFTFVPYMGFDGWDIFATERTFDDSYSQGGTNEFTESDYNAYLKAMTLYDDAELTPINLFVSAGINWYDNNELVKKMIDLIENGRQDFLYLIDAPDRVDPNETSTDTALWYASAIDGADLDTTYGATYAPYIRRKDPDSSVNVFIPPTGEILKALALMDRTAFVWSAPGGLTRGALENAKKVRKSFKVADRDILYPNRINPIVSFANNTPSVYIWGQKTLPQAASKLDRIDVRRLLLYAKQILTAESRRYLFEPNDDILVKNFIFEANKKLKVIQDNRGLKTFRVRIDNTLVNNESRDRNEIYFVIELWPIGAAEFIGLTFVINKASNSLTFDN